MDRDEAPRLLKGGPDGVAEWNRRLSAGEEIPDLTGANFSGAFLFGANLSGAFLVEANLSGALLIEVNLSGASLLGANFSWAFLNGADLEAAVCLRTIFADVDLSDVKGLDKIQHGGADASSSSFAERARSPRRSCVGAVCRMP